MLLAQDERLALEGALEQGLHRIELEACLQ
jgi:hypothetical protein